MTKQWVYRDTVVDPRGGHEGGYDPDKGGWWERHIPAEELEAEAAKTRGWVEMDIGPTIYPNYPELGPRYHFAARHLWDVLGGRDDWFMLKRLPS